MNKTECQVIWKFCAVIEKVLLWLIEQYWCSFNFSFCHFLSLKFKWERVWNERNRTLKMIFGILLGTYGPYLSLFLEIAEEVLVTKLKKWESVTILWYLLVKLFIFVTFSHVLQNVVFKMSHFLKENGWNSHFDDE